MMMKKKKKKKTKKEKEKKKTKTKKKEEEEEEELQGVTRSYKEKSEQQQTFWSLQGCSALNLMYKYNTIYQCSPMIKRKLYGSK